MERMIKLWLLLIPAVGVVNANDGGAPVTKDHNQDAHNALCEVLKEAVGKWGNGGEGLSEPLKTALGRTLFGKGSKGSLEELQRLSDDYGSVKNGVSSRVFLCGQSHQDETLRGTTQPRSSGHSAPHDLVCLCTAGDDGWPGNGTDDGKEMLCGKKPIELGVKSRKEGWGLQKKGITQIQATWGVVVTKCLQRSGKGENLKHSLNIFMGKLKHKPLKQPKDENRYLLGEGDGGEYSCGGNGKACVIYYNSTPPMPWWKDLENALKTEEEAEKQQKKREDEEGNQKDMQKKQESKKQDKSQPQQVPNTAALKSTIPDKQEDEQENQESIIAPLATIEDASGTPIMQLLSLLTVFLFI